MKVETIVFNELSRKNAHVSIQFWDKKQAVSIAGGASGKKLHVRLRNVETQLPIYSHDIPMKSVLSRLQIAVQAALHGVLLQLGQCERVKLQGDGRVATLGVPWRATERKGANIGLKYVNTL